MTRTTINGRTYAALKIDGGYLLIGGHGTEYGFYRHPNGHLYNVDTTGCLKSVCLKEENGSLEQIGG